MQSEGLRVKNEVWGQGVGGIINLFNCEEWRVGGQGDRAWYHKFVYECNLIPLVTEGWMKNFITLVQPPLLIFFNKKWANKFKGF